MYIPTAQNPFNIDNRYKRIDAVYVDGSTWVNSMIPNKAGYEIDADVKPTGSSTFCIFGTVADANRCAFTCFNWTSLEIQMGQFPSNVMITFSSETSPFKLNTRFHIRGGGDRYKFWSYDKNGVKKERNYKSTVNYIQGTRNPSILARQFISETSTDRPFKRIFLFITSDRFIYWYYSCICTCRRYYRW